MEYNQFLKPWHHSQPNQMAGKGYIERPGEIENIVWQTRPAEPTPYENELADALISAFDTGIEELDLLVEHLNTNGVYAPDGTLWTIEVFEREIARLGV